MRRLFFAAFAPLFAAAALAQSPPNPLFPTLPATKPERVTANPLPTALPPLNTQPLHAAPPTTATPTTSPALLPQSLTPEVALPQKEVLARIDANGLTARRQNEKWVVTNGLAVVREFGGTREDAEEFVRLVRELRPTEWGAIGTARVVVEYAVTNGVAATPAFSPKTSVTIDIGSLRAEQVRGVFVVRDDQNILLNFGATREDAEQAVGIIRKYRFNRIGQVGPVGTGATVLFAQDLPADHMKKPSQLPGGYAHLAQAFEEQKLTRTGIDISADRKPGAGVVGDQMVGEKVVIDAQAVELKRDKTGDWKLMHGTDVLANFGPSEWTGRDALKLVKDMRFTEFCRFNSAVSFFLLNGQAPTRVPFAAQASRFDRDSLKVKLASGGKYGLYEGQGRQLFVCDTEKEAEQLLLLLHKYGFDTICQIGLGANTSLRFFAKSGR